MFSCYIFRSAITFSAIYDILMLLFCKKNRSHRLLYYYISILDYYTRISNTEVYVAADGFVFVNVVCVQHCQCILDFIFNSLSL